MYKNFALLLLVEVQIGKKVKKIMIKVKGACIGNRNNQI